MQKMGENHTGRKGHHPFSSSSHLSYIKAIIIFQTHPNPSGHFVQLTASREHDTIWKIQELVQISITTQRVVHESWLRNGSDGSIWQRHSRNCSHFPDQSTRRSYRLTEDVLCPWAQTQHCRGLQGRTPTYQLQHRRGFQLRICPAHVMSLI